MTPEIVLDLFRQALTIIILLVATVVLPGLLLGLIVSIFQAATQINEQTLSFVPRLLITFFTLLITGPWLLSLIIDFTNRSIQAIPSVVG